MPIQSDSPVTLNATLNAWWITSLVIYAPDPSKPVKVQANLSRWDGASIIEANTVTLTVPDLFALAAQNPDVAAAITSLTTALGAVAKSKNVIS